ncbi:18907_t:CDS:1, partial [Gigaspora margarita]
MAVQFIRVDINLANMESLEASIRCEVIKYSNLVSIFEVLE